HGLQEDPVAHGGDRLFRPALEAGHLFSQREEVLLPHRHNTQLLPTHRPRRKGKFFPQLIAQFFCNFSNACVTPYLHSFPRPPEYGSLLLIMLPQFPSQVAHCWHFPEFSGPHPVSSSRSWH